MEAIALLKAGQIGRWLDERRDDVALIVTAQLSLDVERWLDGGRRNDALKSRILEQLSFPRAKRQRRLGLLSAVDGRPLLAMPEGLSDTPATRKAALEAGRRGTTLSLDDVAPESARATFELFSPLSRAEGPANGKALAVLRLSSNAQAELSMLLNAWPGSRASGETVLLRRQDDTWLPLGPQEGPRLRDASTAFGGAAGFFEYRDDGGRDSLAYGVPVAGTPWMLLVRMDRTEAYARLDGVATFSASLLAALLTVFAYWLLSRRQAEAALRRSREDLDRAQEVGQIGWWRLDTRRNILTWSRQNHRIFGIANGTPLSYESFLDIVHPEDRARTDAAWRAALAGAPYDVEHRIIADGRVKWVREKSFLEFDASGSLLGGFGITQDISDRKQAEAALSLTEERFRRMAETIDDVFWISDPELRQVYYVSPAFEKLWGRTCTELVERPGVWLESLDPADAPRVVRALAELKKGRSFAADYRIRRPDGSQRWIFDRGYPVFDDNGKVSLLCGVATDHTQYQTILKTTLDAFWINDMQGRFLDMNETFCRMLGYEREELLAMSLSDVEAVETPEDTRAHIEKLVRVGYDRFETRHRRKDRLLLDIEVTATYLAAAEGRLIVFARDITARKLAEAALKASEELNRRIIASSSDCIKVLDLAGNLLSMSEGGRRQLQIADIQPFIGRSWIEFWQKRDRPVVNSALAAAGAGGVGRFQGYCAAATGAPKWWDVIITPIVGTDGRPERLLAVSRDVTERKAIEDQLKATKAEAERANMAKSRFLAAASHDLRQPLAALSVYVGLLGHRLGGTDAELVLNMQNCVASLNGLLGDLLDLSKLDAGVIEPKLADFCAGRMLSKLISAHAPEAQLMGLELRYRPCPTNTRTDALLLERIVGNLIANAIRHTARGGVLVGCRYRQGRRWIEVWDTGIGIPADKTTEIFEEFKQLGDHARTRGSGLGLAIVAKSAALLSLRIRVASRVGRGSMFAVELPPGAALEAGSEAAAEPRRCRGGRIALIEDNVIVRDSLVFGLEDAGYEVIAAGVGHELARRLDGCAPDVILADYRLLNGETGFDVIAAIRTEFGRDLPSIILTGDTDPDILRSMADRGVLVQHKPVDLQSLRTCIDEIMAEKPA